MRLSITAALLALAIVPIVPIAQQPTPAAKGQRLEELAWPEAERLLTSESIVVIPLGAGSKEHGPHLKLRNDLTMADYLTRRVVEAASVVVAPALTYHHYPAFLEYPGSTSLSLNTARDLTTDVVRTLAAYGPRRFYVLNTGISTLRPLALATEALAADGILLRHTDLNARLAPVAKGLVQQQGGTHADEIETSMMLYIDPSTVDMTKAVKDFTLAPSAGRLTRQRGGVGVYSATGIWGDPTLATAAKGRTLVEALVSGILDDIGQLRTATLPARSSAPATAASGRADGPRPSTAQPDEGGDRTCTPGDYREIRAIGPAYGDAWNQKDPIAFAGLWSRQGNIIHTDGTVEPQTLLEQNRRRLFATREYRYSKHLLELTLLRCFTADIALADGKWELSGLVDAANKPAPPRVGQATLVVKRQGGRWFIEAYRYTVK
jgi:creatinine amidohydrolase